jgi:hypothetical protein
MVFNIKKSSLPVGILLTMYQILIYGLGIVILIALLACLLEKAGQKKTG